MSILLQAAIIWIILDFYNEPERFGYRIRRVKKGMQSVNKTACDELRQQRIDMIPAWKRWFFK